MLNGKNKLKTSRGVLKVFLLGCGICFFVYPIPEIQLANA